MTKPISQSKTILDTSPKTMSAQLHIDGRRIRGILYSKKFTDNFGAASIEESKNRSDIRYKIQAEIEDLIQIILKKYDDFEDLQKEQNAQKILDYTKAIMDSVASLDEYQKLYIQSHSAYKYNQIMCQYYSKFIEKIIILITMFIESDFKANQEENDIAFRKVISSLDETIRDISLSRTLKRSGGNFSKYSINNAIKDTISFSERKTTEYYSPVLNGILKTVNSETGELKYEIMKNGIPNHDNQGLKGEYLKATNSKKLSEMKKQKYTQLIVDNTPVDIITEAYFNDYIRYFGNL